MGVDAATTGRLSIALYEEPEHSRLLEQLLTWHEETSVMRYAPKQRKHELNPLKKINYRFVNHSNCF